MRDQPQPHDGKLPRDMGKCGEDAQRDWPEPSLRQMHGSCQHGETAHGSAQTQYEAGRQELAQQECARKHPQQTHPRRGCEVEAIEDIQRYDIGDARFNARQGRRHDGFHQVQADGKRGQPGNAMIVSSCFDAERLGPSS